jgi:hypothetical protein
MKKSTLQVAKGLDIPATNYATQANAVLGIREAGKTYTAMKFAEELLECSVPIIVFDPVGMWKNLKIGTGSHKGYPIVVAGGQGSDITLTKENAVDIVRAAMKENISLVIDLYSPELINKSTWISIVQNVVDLLMYENKAYPVRHIFLEEAAEFIPQKLQPQHARVYASLERVARMGRNAHLGMTIINQRAEEVNKAILEICELCMIHRQVGKNSLLSIQKWLEIRQLEGVREIMKSLPVLSKGEGWIVGLDDQPRRVQILKKNTYHPNPKDLASGEKKVVQSLARDVSSFVSKMNEQLELKNTKTAEKYSPKSTKNIPSDPDLVKRLQAEIDKLQKLLVAKDNDLIKAIGDLAKYSLFVDELQNFVSKQKPTNPGGPWRQKITAAPPKIEITVPAMQSVPKVQEVTSGSSLDGAARKIISFLAQYPDRAFSIVQIAVATNYSSKGGGFKNAIYRLNTLGFILKAEKIRVNPQAMEAIISTIGPIKEQDYGFETYKENLDKAERECYQVLIDHAGTALTPEEIAARTETGYSPSGGGFKNALYRLRSLELSVKENGAYKLNPELLEL